MITANRYDAVIASPVGNIGLNIINGALSQLDYVDCGITSDNCKTTDKLHKELQLYFQKPDYVFQFPVDPAGTPFQQKVWRALQQIPPGETLTYGELAKQLNSSPRAVGQACRRNPIPIVIPCHRVLGKSNAGGYAGNTNGMLFGIKKWLLAHEGVKI